MRSDFNYLIFNYLIKNSETFLNAWLFPLSGEKGKGATTRFQISEFQIVGTHRVRPRKMNNNCGDLATEN